MYIVTHALTGLGAAGLTILALLLLLGRPDIRNHRRRQRALRKARR